MATIHNPVNFEPADYEVQDYLDNKRPVYMGGPADGFAEVVKCWEQDMEAALGVDWRRKCHHCIHCGNGNVRWITVVLHLPTNDRVVFGADCTERLGFANRQAWKLAQLKSKAEAGHARLKVWKARCAFIEANPGVQALIDQAAGDVHQGNTFVKDVLGKLDRYGSISVNQVNAVAKSLQRDIDQVARKAADAIEVKGPAPSGRQEVTGTVLTIKTQESDYGITLKMLLKLANNSKVWLTAPITGGFDKGDTITVRATFEQSRDDASFGFGKRPHLVNVVKAAVL